VKKSVVRSASYFEGQKNAKKVRGGEVHWYLRKREPEETNKGGERALLRQGRRSDSRQPVRGGGRD